MVGLKKRKTMNASLRCMNPCGPFYLPQVPQSSIMLHIHNDTVVTWERRSLVLKWVTVFSINPGNLSFLLRL